MLNLEQLETRDNPTVDPLGPLLPAPSPEPPGMVIMPPAPVEQGGPGIPVGHWITAFAAVIADGVRTVGMPPP